jgi:hypothetical protein
MAWKFGVRSATPTLGDSVPAKYQQVYNEADALVQRQVALGAIANDPLVIGGRTDAIARFNLRSWLRDSQGITEGRGSIVEVNRRLYDPSGSGAYRVPDVRIPGESIIFDGYDPYFDGDEPPGL